MHTKFWSENLKGRRLLVDLGVDERGFFFRILKKQNMGVWTGFTWLTTEKGRSSHLQRYQTKKQVSSVLMLRISGVASIRFS
jgi:hypothetical protein